jgi:hypothetical protein
VLEETDELAKAGVLAE